MPGEVLGRQAVVGHGARHELAQDVGGVRTVQHQLRQQLQQSLESCTTAAGQRQAKDMPKGVSTYSEAGPVGSLVWWITGNFMTIYGLKYGQRC